MLALSNEVEQNQRYQSPPMLSHAGQVDRRHENEHAVAIRDYERQAREGVATAAAEAVKDIAWIQGRARVVTEAKYAIDRAQKESEIIAQGDPVKQAKCSILDDESFAQMRTIASKSQPQIGNRLFG
jgi:hypothetical protein